MHSTLWSHVGFGGMLGQYAFAAAAGHPYLLAILRYVRQASVEPSWARVPVSAARAPALGTRPLRLGTRPLFTRRGCSSVMFPTAVTHTVLPVHTPSSLFLTHTVHTAWTSALLLGAHDVRATST